MIAAARLGAALVALVVLVAALTPALHRAEQITLDTRFELRGTQPVSGLAVVAIDERSFSELELQWPFPRSEHARMIDRLREAGVRQIVYDVQFTEPSEDPDEDAALYDAVARAQRVILATGEIDDEGRTRVLGGERASPRRAAHAPPRVRSRPIPVGQSAATHAKTRSSRPSRRSSASASGRRRPTSAR